MEAKAIGTQTEQPTIAVAKADLIRAWSSLEKLVVSLRKMGSFYATADAQTPLSPEQHRQMLEDLDEFFGPEMVRELTQSRRALSNYIDDEEGEVISQRLKFWDPKQSATRVRRTIGKKA